MFHFNSYARFGILAKKLHVEFSNNFLINIEKVIFRYKRWCAVQKEAGHHCLSKIAVHGGNFEFFYSSKHVKFLILVNIYFYSDTSL